MPKCRTSVLVTIHMVHSHFKSTTCTVFMWLTVTLKNVFLLLHATRGSAHIVIEGFGHRRKGNRVKWRIQSFHKAGTTACFAQCAAMQSVFFIESSSPMRHSPVKKISSWRESRSSAKRHLKGSYKQTEPPPPKKKKSYDQQEWFKFCDDY